MSKKRFSIRDQLRKVSLLRKIVLCSKWLFGSIRFKLYFALAPRKRIVLGASGRHDPGWIPTEIYFLNILNESNWRSFFDINTIDAMMAEHVWEHLSQKDGVRAAYLCFQYLKPGGYIRIAVPDGFHPDSSYIDEVKVNGLGPGATDHKVLYNYKTFSEIFESVGFSVKLNEYFDEFGDFHFENWSISEGKIWRSKRFDDRNTEDKLKYSSIILDAIK